MFGVENIVKEFLSFMRHEFIDEMCKLKNKKMEELKMVFEKGHKGFKKKDEKEETRMDKIKKEIEDEGLSLEQKTLLRDYALTGWRATHQNIPEDMWQASTDYEALFSVLRMLDEDIRKESKKEE